MSLAGLALDASNRAPIVLLRDPSGRRQVPIWIDHAQAHNIMAGFKQTHQKQPLSHDLMISLIKAGKLKLDRVIIHSIEDSTFHAVLKLQQEKPRGEKAIENSQKILEINARPSDAIALAIRAQCTIWMLEEVVAEASIPVDIDADEEDQSEFRRFLDALSPAELIRHLKDHNQENPDRSDSRGNS